MLSTKYFPHVSNEVLSARVVQAIESSPLVTTIDRAAADTWRLWQGAAFRRAFRAVCGLINSIPVRRRLLLVSWGIFVSVLAATMAMSGSTAYSGLGAVALLCVAIGVATHQIRGSRKHP